MKNLNSRIISALIGIIGTLVVVLIGTRGVVTQADLKDIPTKIEVQYMIAGVEDESEYKKDQRMLRSHMNRTNNKLDSIDKKISDLQITMSALKVEVKNIKDNLPKENK